MYARSSFAPINFAPLSLVRINFASFKLAPLRSVSLKSASVRSAWTRNTVEFRTDKGHPAKIRSIEACASQYRPVELSPAQISLHKI